MKLTKWLSRKWIWLYSRIVREKASPEYIARGWAIGMFYGCMIPFGLQLICSIPTSFLLKGSKIGATLGTLLTNHFTIFFLYPAQCWVGNKIIGGDITYQTIKIAFMDVLEKQNYKALFAIGGELVASFFIGAALLMIVCTPLTYFVVLRVVKRYRARKALVQNKIARSNMN